MQQRLGDFRRVWSLMQWMLNEHGVCTLYEVYETCWGKCHHGHYRSTRIQKTSRLVVEGGTSVWENQKPVNTIDIVRASPRSSLGVTNNQMTKRRGNMTKKGEAAEMGHGRCEVKLKQSSYQMLPAGGSRSAELLSLQILVFRVGTRSKRGTSTMPRQEKLCFYGARSTDSGDGTSWSLLDSTWMMVAVLGGSDYIGRSSPEGDWRRNWRGPTTSSRRPGFGSETETRLAVVPMESGFCLKAVCEKGESEVRTRKTLQRTRPVMPVSSPSTAFVRRSLSCLRRSAAGSS